MKKIFIFPVTAIIFLLMLSVVQAVAYIKFDGIDGETQNKDHKGWSDILSFSWGMHQPTLNFGRVSIKNIIIEDFVFVKEIDKASPKLMESVTSGAVFPNVEIELTKEFIGAESVPYLRYKLKNVQITSYNVSSFAEEDSVPIEQMSLNFEEIKVEYIERDSTGRAKGFFEFIWNLMRRRR